MGGDEDVLVEATAEARRTGRRRSLTPRRGTPRFRTWSRCRILVLTLMSVVDGQQRLRTLQRFYGGFVAPGAVW